MGVQMRAKTEETAMPLIENNDKCTKVTAREIIWATTIYLISWHILAIICTVLYMNNTKLMTIMWSK